MKIGKLKRSQCVYPLIGLFVLFPFVWIALDGSSGTWSVESDNGMQQQVFDLRERMNQIVASNIERKADLLSLKEQMDLIVRAHHHQNGSIVVSNHTRRLLQNMTFLSGEMKMAGIFHYLPHLIGNPAGLTPAFKLSKDRFNVPVLMAIPHIRRSHESYLVQTLTSLLDSLSAADRLNCMIVLFIAEPYDMDYVKEVSKMIEDSFSWAVESGLVEIVVPAAQFYPDLEHIVPTFGDLPERARWRTKQNLDFSFLMMYARSRATYYLQLEDDIITKPGFFSNVINFVRSQQNSNWFILEFSHLGFIGKLMKTRDLPMFVEFILMFHRDKPIDWLLDHFLTVKVCNPEKNNKHCQRSVMEIRRRYRPSLFQHVGTHSSLKGKVQKLKDKDFGKKSLVRGHKNPSAIVSTSLEVYQRYSLALAYSGDSIFWALTPRAGDTAIFLFSQPMFIKSFRFVSGSKEHPDDKFFNTSIEICTQSATQATSLQAEEFVAVGKFDDKTGSAQQQLGRKYGLIKSLRLNVLSASSNWVILSEILIVKAEEGKR